MLWSHIGRIRLRKVKRKYHNADNHGLRTPREEIAFSARPKIHSHSQIFSYGGIIFCLPHRPNFSDIFDLCLHWVSVVRGQQNGKSNVTHCTILKTILKISLFHQKQLLKYVSKYLGKQEILLFFIYFISKFGILLF